LLKNGVTRESLLGYSVDQFSTRVLETFDSLRLEQALEILLDCYRDIRYSVSPRFELETAISKLTWLNRWVSPPELKAALDNAQYALRGQGGVSRPLAEGGVNPPGAQRPPGGNNPPQHKPYHGGNKPHGGHSLAEEYRRMLAAKANAPPELDAADDDEEPAWSGIIHNSGNPSGDESQGDESPVDRVLRLIPGTVVN
jgi:DNA polymerase-3 subunit gamma/tau